MGTFRTKEQRSANKKGRSIHRARRMEDAILSGMARVLVRRERRAEARAADREVNRTRSHHSGDGRITVWRRED